jgi:adenine-specific DNA-methyltransferase
MIEKLPLQPHALDNAPLLEQPWGLNWPGKREARKMAMTSSRLTLKPLPGEGMNEENAQHLLIEGDNLEVLKILQKTYFEQIKMIYIDPPYNTGNDFIYKDDFAENLQDYIDTAGLRLNSNRKDSGRFHANWLSFMYPRLRLAKQLLRDDGVIFVSIDDNEVHNLRAVMNEIFGEENFIGCIVRPTGQTTGQDSGGLGSSFDYLLVCSKSPNRDLNGLPLDENDLKRFENEDENGKYAYDQMRKTGSNDRRTDRPNMYYALKDPDGNLIYPTGPGGYESCWRFEEKTYKKLLTESIILWKKTQKEGKEVWWPYVKYYLEGRTKRPSPLWNDLEGNKKASRELRELFNGEKIFDFPKPTALLKRIVSISTENHDMILDFFAGSGTTAQAVLELNQEDGGNRKFILVQIDEPTDPRSEAFRAGYATISAITKARIRKVLEKMHPANPPDGQAQIEYKSKEALPGFKVYRWHTSNFREWQEPEVKTVEQVQISFDKAAESRLNTGFAEVDVITEVMLQKGFPLHLPVSRQESFTVNKVWEVVREDGDGLLICLDASISPATAGLLTRFKHHTFICRDEAITDQVKVVFGDVGYIETI